MKAYDSGDFSSEDFDENCIAKGSPANLLNGHRQVERRELKLESGAP